VVLWGTSGRAAAQYRWPTLRFLFILILISHESSSDSITNDLLLFSGTDGTKCVVFLRAMQSVDPAAGCPLQNIWRPRIHSCTWTAQPAARPRCIGRRR
jgi:hypothetical protein